VYVTVWLTLSRVNCNYQHRELTREYLLPVNGERSQEELENKKIKKHVIKKYK